MSFSSLVSSRNAFGLPSNTRGGIRAFANSLLLYSSDGESFIPADDVQSNELITQYKILLSKVTCEHAGEPDSTGKFRVLSRMQVIKPNELCTDSYLIIGGSTDKVIVDNTYQYLKTRFVRFLILQAVTSINLSKDKFQFVPVQDFSQSWTDEKLYAKYSLSPDEIAYIESLIKPME